jgi:hypothetical protein
MISALDHVYTTVNKCGTIPYVLAKPALQRTFMVPFIQQLTGDLLKSSFSEKKFIALNKKPP